MLTWSEKRMNVYCLPVSDEHSDMIRQAFAESCDTFIFMYQSKLRSFTAEIVKKVLKIDVLMSLSGFIPTLRLGYKKFFMPLRMSQTSYLKFFYSYVRIHMLQLLSNICINLWSISLFVSHCAFRERICIPAFLLLRLCQSPAFLVCIVTH